MLLKRTGFTIIILKKMSAKEALKTLYQKNRKECILPKVIREYEKMGVTKLSDEKYHIRYKLTNKQKKIIKELGLKEKDYIEFANKVIPSDRKIIEVKIHDVKCCHDSM